MPKEYKAIRDFFKWNILTCKCTINAYLNTRVLYLDLLYIKVKIIHLLVICRLLECILNG